VDSFSTDGTGRICLSLGAKFVQHAWPGINAQREFALTQTKHEWVFCLDADEVASEELGAEIVRMFGGNSRPSSGHDGFMVPRHTFYLGRWIDHGGWYPDLKLRLFRKARARFVGSDPHDRAEVAGSVGTLKGEIAHYTYDDISDHIATIDGFSTTFVRRWVKDGRRFSLAEILLRPPLKFLETYFLKLGMLDGFPGLVISVATSFYAFVKHAKLWEAQRNERREMR
jgi:glycosyltransferase involved in cell wall biosynthesis